MYTYYVIKSQDASLGDMVFKDLDLAQYYLEKQKRIFGDFQTMVIETSDTERKTKDKIIKKIMKYETL